MRKNIFLLLISLILSLFAAEVTMQVYAFKTATPRSKEPKTDWAIVPERVWTEYHAQLGWFHQKNKKSILEKGSWRVEINTNNEGIRGVKNYLTNKPDGVKRILVLGDSFVFGWGVGDQETFSAYLEQTGKNLEVLNLGVAGFGIDQILISYRMIGRKYNPDIVVIGIFPEDFWRATRSFADSGYAKPYFSLTKNKKLKLHNVPVPPKYTLKYNQFPDLIEYNWVESVLRKSQLYRLSQQAIMRLGKNLKLLDPDSTVEWLFGQVILSELVREVRSDDALPILMIMPPDRWMRNTKLTSLERSVQRFAQRENVHLINLTPIFIQAVKEFDLTNYYIKDDWHWTAKGHHIVAEELSRYIANATN